MYRLLVVDDENYVVDTISTLLESRIDVELDICRAYSVTEALQWLNRAKIDIVITDIQMPELSGIALAEKINYNWPQCKIIFFTAYAEFDYAYAAIKNNVIGFVLKTESEDRILEAVDKAIELLNHEIKNLELHAQVQKQLENSISVVRKDIMFSLLKDNYNNQSELFDQLKNIGSNIKYESTFWMIVGRIDHRLPDLDIWERFQKIGMVQNAISQYLEKSYNYEYMEYAPNKITCILQSKNETIQNETPVRNDGIFIAGMLESVQQSCSEVSGINVSFILHGECFLAESISDIFHSLDRLLKLYASENDSFIITDTHLTTQKRNYQSEYSGNSDTKDTLLVHTVENLKNYLESNNKDLFKSELGQLMTILEKKISWHDTTAWEIYYYVAAILIAFVNQRDIKEKVAFKIGLNILYNPRLEDSWSHVADYLIRLSDELFDLQKSEQQQFSSNIIDFLMKYMNNHIAEDVSLTKLSEVSGYNAVYLTRVFKKKTGETINDYMSRKKLGYIKKLMSDDKMSIGDISEKAGFEYRSYFNKFIRKNTGMSPQELRDSCKEFYK